jgi:predicted nucleic-acid-binding protein
MSYLIDKNIISEVQKKVSDVAQKCDFADGYLARTNRSAGCEASATFDRKAARLDDFEKL